MIRRAVLSLVLVFSLVLPSLAVEPDEMLDDPVLEARAQGLDDILRCVQCRSESIASSNAGWAKDARLLVRELVAAGLSDAEVQDYFVARYGEVVLMRPKSGGINTLLWLSGPFMLLIALGVAVAYVRRRKTGADGPAPLNEDEKAQLEKLLGE